MSGRWPGSPTQEEPGNERRNPAEAGQRYLTIVGEQLSAAAGANRDSLHAAARILADAVAADGVIHVAGAGHSQLLALELGGRAGGLATIDVIYDPTWGAAEAVAGYASTLLREVVFGPYDCLVVVSTSGRNMVPVEMALAGQLAGLPIVAVTSIRASQAAASRHPSGKRLFELADVVLDTGTLPGDATIEVSGAMVRTGPTSTVTGAALLHAAVAGAIEELALRGVEPPLLLSNNVEGGPERNAAIRARYAGRVRTPI
jgi:uncharacterized phosphosugar-binding protein